MWVRFLGVVGVQEFSSWVRDRLRGSRFGVLGLNLKQFGVLGFRVFAWV